MTRPQPALRAPILIPIAALALSVAACSGTSETPDAGIAGDSGVEADSGVEPDAGEEVDAGVGPCNPVDGTGCEMDNYCVYQSMTDKGTCRELINAMGFEEVCDTGLQNCDPGMVCLKLSGENAATCRKVCRLREGTGCEGLGAGDIGAAASYACTLRLAGVVRTYGLCAPAADRCDPLDNMCGAQENCEIVQDDGTTGCIVAGSQPLGANCSMNSCRRGGVCWTMADVSMTPTCYEPCTLPNGMCTTANYACVNVGLPFGLCAPM
ncbi:MAG: hypothetical protein KC933_18725 [Myxococcales bacterium]|nr:hypothetical protein [Myxococcales bacterium]